MILDALTYFPASAFSDLLFHSPSPFDSSIASIAIYVVLINKVLTVLSAWKGRYPR